LKIVVHPKISSFYLKNDNPMVPDLGRKLGESLYATLMKQEGPE